jgi:protein gp37
MNKTQIEWVKNPDGTQGYTWNPITGCLNHTPEGLCLGGLFPCYAYKLANGRLKQRYLVNHNTAPLPIGVNLLDIDIDSPFYPRFWAERLEQPFDAPGSAGIFVCDMGELFGDWIPIEWQEAVFNVIKIAQQHRFYLLTKQPQNLIKFSPFPDNCWVGVTATNTQMADSALRHLYEIKAKVKFLSLEPLLSWRPLFPISFPSHLNWLIIGAMTCGGGDLARQATQFPQLTPMPYGKKYTLQPPISWVEEIVKAADKAGIPVFLKDNLKPLLANEINGKLIIESHNLWAFKEFKLRQEMPGG